MNVLTAGDDAQKYIDENVCRQDALDSAMQALRKRSLLLIKPWKSSNDVSNLVTRDSPR